MYKTTCLQNEVEDKTEFLSDCRGHTGTNAVRLTNGYDVATHLSCMRLDMESDDLERPAKRARAQMDDGADVTAGQQQQPGEPDFPLLSLPDGVLHQVLLCLPAPSLLAMYTSCRYFKNLAERVAKEKLVAEMGYKQAARWRDYSWLQRLVIEETATKFDLERATAQSFDFTETATSQVVREIKLDQPGPRLLLSDVSTAQAHVLRWKLQLRGNNAAEFGVVPLDMQDHTKALHKCIPNPAEERATGFSSAITVGSLLPARLPIMKDTVVEILVTPREISFIITNPEDGAEMVWQNNSTVSRAYKGPRELRLQLPNSYQGPVKLAVTAWQRAAFDVLHTLSGQELKQLQQQRAAATAGTQQAGAGSKAGPGSQTSRVPRLASTEKRTN